MALVTVDRVQAGMILAAPVDDRKGRRLIPAEVALTERHIEALKMWGIPHVDIEGAEAEAETSREIPPEEEERIRAETDAHFGESDRKHPYISALYDYAVNRALDAASHGGT